MRHCAWEDADFPTGEFESYRGRIYLHTTGNPVHLSNGELPDNMAGVESADAADVEMSPEPWDTGEAS